MFQMGLKPPTSKCMVNLRDFPDILVNCFGWCHKMIFALDYFLAAVVFLKDHFFKDHSFIQAGCCLFFVGKSPGPYSLKKGLHLQNVIPKDWNLKNPLEQ